METRAEICTDVCMQDYFFLFMVTSSKENLVLAWKRTRMLIHIFSQDGRQEQSAARTGEARARQAEDSVVAERVSTIQEFCYSHNLWQDPGAGRPLLVRVNPELWLSVFHPCMALCTMEFLIWEKSLGDICLICLISSVM